MQTRILIDLVLKKLVLQDICCLAFSQLFFQGASVFLTSWLWSLSAVILEPGKIKSAADSAFPPSIYHEVMGPDATILVLM